MSGGAKVEEEDRKLRVPGGGGGTGKWMNVVLLAASLPDGNEN